MRRADLGTGRLLRVRRFKREGRRGHIEAESNGLRDSGARDVSRGRRRSERVDRPERGKATQARSYQSREAKSDAVPSDREKGEEQQKFLADRPRSSLLQHFADS